ncbi:MAG: domain containing protein [Solirubrobacterales bacterium]|nr:domain containing protein [Solirubrobacterales bacterium]
MKSAPKAGWWQRVGATLIDGLILVAGALVVGIALSGGGAIPRDTTYAMYAVVFLASLIYSPMLMAREGDANGQTIGKRAMGIRVVHADGHPMTLSRGLLRDGVGKALLGIIPLYTIADVLLPLLDAHNQAIHDKVGSTYVVDAHQVPVVTERSQESFAAPTPHESWSAPSQPVAPPPPSAPPPAPADEPETNGEPTAPPPPPDLGGFSPPVPPTPPPRSDEEPSSRGPFGPSYD